ncbi:unnamed protein product [Rotaria magnacalcarata]|uniref:Uncharacterized protein n=2 Tax=Rotaria magnacalcarata TaxID=392030 RepID=A0A815V0N1_9BILA|nr:unnamed protein product [Rotaria magnacalcarata]CAF1523570.1 unnamed protein product [Rotaria magnacalcarata]CAF4892620.1 unnamed protein product [Rotaria magnacalcarata]CAF5029462.1 unnamed protein product [Rotaria magnacalcarata]
MNDMMEININSMPDNEQIKEDADEDEEEEEEEQPLDQDNLEILNVKTNLFINICQSSSIFFILVIILIIPISQVAVGWHYSTACPINQSIPYYLVVSGIVGFLLVLLISVSQMIARTMPNVVFDDAVNRANVNRATMLVGCGACSIMCISLTLFVFLFGWSIAGWAWVLEAWHRVQFQHEANNDYCHPLVYRFTVALLLIKVSYNMVFFCWLCRKACPKIINFQRKKTVTTLEC